MERGIIFNDETLKIDWKFPIADLIISEKDKLQPALKEADLFYKQKKFKEAAETYEEYLLEIPKDDKKSLLKKYDRLAFIYHRLRNYEKAIKYYTYSIEIEPSNYRLLQRAKLYAKEGQLEYAIDDYEDGVARAKARAQDTYTDWTKIDIPRLDPGDSALCFVDPIGFRFHLPAYMCHAIKQNAYTLSGYIEIEPLIDHFQIANDHGKRMTAEFDQAQFAACSRFLIYIAEEQFTRESEYCDDTERLAKDMYDYQSPLRIMRVAWWQYLSDEERQALLFRWPVLQDEPF